jgi:dTDP-4-amino-4,6-dideoxygalactose transaminase
MGRGNRKEFLVFGAPDIGEREIDEVVATLRSGWIGTGPRTASFEETFRNYLGIEHAVALNSGTAALHLALLASGIGPGDEVITTPLTFCATVNAIIHCGATPVLADVDSLTGNLDAGQVLRHLTPRTRAILPVHYTGRPCEMETLCDLAKQYRLRLIEDCAHAIETKSLDRHAGTFGDVGCFSFYATKNLTTGEGGMAVTRDPELASRIKQLALHGLSHDAWSRFSDAGYRHHMATEVGFKYNMTDIQAALGIHQLAALEQKWQLRAKLWDYYVCELADLPVTLPTPSASGTRHAYHLFTVLVDNTECGIERDHFLEEMTEKKIGVGVHYLSLPEHPVYRRLYGWRPEDYPNAMRIGRTTVSLPLSSKVTMQDVDDVVEAVRSVLSG